MWYSQLGSTWAANDTASAVAYALSLPPGPMSGTTCWAMSPRSGRTATWMRRARGWIRCRRAPRMTGLSHRSSPHGLILTRKRPAITSANCQMGPGKARRLPAFCGTGVVRIRRRLPIGSANNQKARLGTISSPKWVMFGPMSIRKRQVNGLKVFRRASHATRLLNLSHNKSCAQIQSPPPSWWTQFRTVVSGRTRPKRSPWQWFQSDPGWRRKTWVALPIAVARPIQKQLRQSEAVASVQSQDNAFWPLISSVTRSDSIFTTVAPST